MRLASSNEGDCNIPPLELLKDSQLDNPGDSMPWYVCWPIRKAKKLGKPTSWAPLLLRGSAHLHHFCHEPLPTILRKSTVRPVFLCSPHACLLPILKTGNFDCSSANTMVMWKQNQIHANAENISSSPHFPKELRFHKILWNHLYNHAFLQREKTLQ